jgi:hypothetical protein
VERLNTGGKGPKSGSCTIEEEKEVKEEEK